MRQKIIPSENNICLLSYLLLQIKGWDAAEDCRGANLDKTSLVVGGGGWRMSNPLNLSKGRVGRMHHLSTCS